jgi:hypothetical protein
MRGYASLLGLAQPQITTGLEGLFAPITTGLRGLVTTGLNGPFYSKGTKITTGLEGLGTLDIDTGDSMGVDEAETQENDAPRSDLWNFLAKATEVTPTALVKGVDAYKSYTTTGGGTNGVVNAALSIFGQSQQTNQAAAAANAVAAQKKAQQAQAAASPWYKNPVVIVGAAAVAGVGIWAWKRK